MPPVTRYTNPIVARQAAAYLTSNGVIALAIPYHDAFGGSSIVEVSNPAHLDLARSLLGKFHLLKPEYGESLEDQAVPDLSKLTPGYKPTCPACGAGLPLDAVQACCASCNASVNVVDRIIELFGPEALDGCYPDDPEGNLTDLSDEQVNKLEIFCPSCHYSLFGLPVRSQCPECGRPYSKRTILDNERLFSFPGMTDDQVQLVDIACPHCDYSLKGLPTKGYCPECGQAYSKRDLLKG